MLFIFFSIPLLPHSPLATFTVSLLHVSIKKYHHPQKTSSKKISSVNLNACKGECLYSRRGLGAPLEEEEVQILEEIYQDVKPFLRPEGIAAIEAQGTSIKTASGELEN